MKNYGEENGWEIDVDFPYWGNNEIYVKTISKTYLQSGEKPKDAYWRVAAAVAKRLEKPQLATKFFDYMWKGWLCLATPVLSNTGTDIRVYRGGTELTNKPAGFTSPQRDAYGVTGYQNQCRISIYSKSSHLTLANGWLPGSYITGVPAQMPNISGWTDPSTNVTAEIVYQIDCEYVSGSLTRPGTTLFKTQSLLLLLKQH